MPRQLKLPDMSDERDDRWPPGTVIPIRHVQEGVVRFCEAVIVVEDQGDRLITFAPLGGDMRWNSIDWATGAFGGIRPQKRHTTSALRFHRVGARHMVTLFFVDGVFLCWYVDLQEPTRRAGGGLMTFDRSLDIVIGPDRAWRWKDEDHFRHIQRFGWITAQQADELRQEGLAVIAQAEAGAPPFDGAWLDFKPDPAWPLPELPDDWDRAPL